MKDIWVPISGQIAQQRKVDTIANNIANANTKGFKKDDVVFREQLTALTKGIDHVDLPNKEWSPKDFYHSHGAENAKVKVDGSFTDFSQGQLEPTQNPFDFALYGKGFFEVQTPRGIRFSRVGSFTVDKDGFVADIHGNKLLVEAKEQKEGEEKEFEPIEKRFLQIPENIKKVTVTQDGSVYIDRDKLGKISVVEFNDLHALKKEGSNLFINDKANNFKPAELSKTSVHQGYVEGSNVNAVGEMAKLIKAHRHFENIQKAVEIYDGINGKLINDLGRY